MFRKRSILVLFALLVAVSSFAIDPANLNTISFSNDTGFDIWYLYLSPGDSGEWGTDILGTTNTFDDGDTVSYLIHYPDRCNEFDIMAVDEDGDAYEVWGHEICDGRESEVVFTLDDLSTEDWDFDLVEVTLENDTGYDIWYLFFSPGDSDMWGVDQLDSSTVLEDGDEISLFLPANSVSTRYDVHAVDEDEDTYTFFVEVDDSDDDWYFTIELSDIDM